MLVEAVPIIHLNDGRGYYARLNDVGREELSTVCSEEITFIPSSFFNRFCLSSEF